MVRAYHAIFTTYGFWLPNDPRGSWSDWIRSWELLQYGRATKISTRQSVARRPHNEQHRLDAKQALKFPPVALDGHQARAVALEFTQAVEESKYIVHACAILPEHVHVVVLRHEHRIEQIVGHLKGRATRRLIEDELHPQHKHRWADGTIPSPWAQGFWKVFLDTDDDIRRAIKYVYKNPIREGKRPQRWGFMTSHDSS
jgi:REP element-mobilizing transposase RayT